MSGGPGGSGIEFLQSAAIVMPPEIADRFDLVSFDPRGVGASTSVECDVDFDDEIALLAPGDDEGWQALVAEAEARFPDEVPLPPFWGGYRLSPRMVEFWQGRRSRMHDRFAYLRAGDGWRIERLAP